MMKRHFLCQCFPVFAGALCLLLSCNRYDPQTLSLPEDAYMTIHFNSKTLNKKGNWSWLSKEWFPVDSASLLQDSIWMKLMSPNEKTGIDWQKGLYLSSGLRGAGRFRMLQGMLKDNTTFLLFSKRMQGSAQSTVTEDLHIQTLDNQTIVLWNDYRFLCIADAPVVTEEIERKENTMEYVPPYTIPTDSLEMIARSIFHASPRNSLLNDERLGEMLKDPADLNIFTDPSSLYSAPEEGLAGVWQSMSLLSAEGSRTALQVYFEKGEVHCQATEYVNEAWSALLENDPPAKITEEMIHRIPAELSTVLIALNFPPKALPELLKQKSLFQLFDAITGHSPALSDKIAAASKGTLLLAMGNIPRAAETMKADSGGDARTYTKIVAAGTIGNRQETEKLFTFPEDKNGAAAFTRGLTTFAMNAGWFAAGNDSAAVHSVLNGKGNVHPYAKEMSGHFLALHADLETLHAGENHLPGKNAWKKLKMTGDLSEKGRLKMTVVLQTADAEKGFFQ